MAEIKAKELREKAYITMNKTEFATHVGGVTSQALDYALREDIIDYTYVGKHRVIVLTPKTKLYTPNEHKNRTIMRT